MKHTDRIFVALLLVAGILFLCLPQMDVIAAELQTYAFNTLELMSVNLLGTKSNSMVDSVSVSTDGQYVAFDTGATNLVTGTTNAYKDVFVKDRETGLVQRVSISSAGGVGNNNSRMPSISGDGRYVAFMSMATNLVAGDTNGSQDIFVYDRLTEVIVLASVSADGTQANGVSQNPKMCGNGSHVVFESYATNLVDSDTNGMADIFIKNLSTGAVELVSTATDGTQANNTSSLPDVSADCRYVVFKTRASNLSAIDTNNRYDIFIKDRTTGTTTRVSDTAAGSESNNHSDRPAVSNDGQVVAFASDATNFVTGDNNGGTDVYVKNLQNGAVTLASVATNGNSNNGFSMYPSISGDGRYVAFYSSSTDLDADDTNGTWDIFVFDRSDSSTVMVSKTDSDGIANGPSYDPKISNDGTAVAFVSSASNMLSGDADDTGDAYLVTYVAPQLATPTLVGPDDDSSSYNTSPVFDWEDVTDATGYTLQYSTDEAFSSPTEETVAVSTFTPSSIWRLGEWFWRVKATGDAPESEWSAVWNYTVLESSTDDFMITVKTDNDGTTNDNQFFIGTTGSGYNYNVDCDNDGTNEATDETGLYTCTYAAPGTYTIRHPRQRW